MQGRLTFCLIPQLLICTTAFAQSTTPAATTAERTFWDHNGSVMYLVANGSSREFYYQKPRPGMLEAGAHPDSLLFRGQIDNGQFSGTAYLFNAHCGQVPFEVKGPVLDNGGRVALTGQAPRVGRNCQASGYYTSTLEFRLLKSTEVEQPPQPCKTAQAPNVEELKPEVPLSDVGEPKLPGAPSAQPPATARTPPLQPSPTTQVPIATEDFGDQRLLATCNHCDERGASLPVNRDLNLVVKIGRVSRRRICRMSAFPAIPCSVIWRRLLSGPRSKVVNLMDALC
jgi:hypothetical protein